MTGRGADGAMGAGVEETADKFVFEGVYDVPYVARNGFRHQRYQENWLPTLLMTSPLGAPFLKAPISTLPTGV